jgi:hypothetical protein
MDVHDRPGGCPSARQKLAACFEEGGVSLLTLAREWNPPVRVADVILVVQGDQRVVHPYALSRRLKMF